MKYCVECGHKLELKPLDQEGEIPYCPKCHEHRFPTFNSAISTILFNMQKDKILLIQQYGRNSNILVAGYINKGENANEALLREVKEEVGLDVHHYIYNDNFYFAKSNTLIHNYIAFVKEEAFHLTSEVDFAKWYSIDEAIQVIKPHSLAKQFLLQVLHKQGFTKHVLQYEDNKIYFLDAYDNISGIVEWEYKEDKANITHTFVDPSLRGLGIASILMEETIQHLISMHKIPIPICSYAKHYFNKKSLDY